MSQSRDEMGTPDDSAAMRIESHTLLGPLPDAAEVHFTFDGQPVVGRAGEPIIAALFAAGIRVLRTMPQSGEARGGWCLVGRCTDCLVVVDGVPNIPACITPVADGVCVTTQYGLDDSDGNALDPPPAPNPSTAP